MIGRQDWDLSSDWPRVVTDRCWRPSLVWSSAGDGPAQVSVHNSLQPYWYSAQWYWQTLCYSQISTHYYRHYWTRTRSEWSVISGYSPVELIDPGDLQSQDKPRQQLPPVIRRQPGKQTILSLALCCHQFPQSESVFVCFFPDQLLLIRENWGKAAAAVLTDSDHVIIAEQTCAVVTTPLQLMTMVWYQTVSQQNQSSTALLYLAHLLSSLLCCSSHW